MEVDTRLNHRFESEFFHLNAISSRGKIRNIVGTGFVGEALIMDSGAAIDDSDCSCVMTVLLGSVTRPVSDASADCARSIPQKNGRPSNNVRTNLPMEAQLRFDYAVIFRSAMGRGAKAKISQSGQKRKSSEASCSRVEKSTNFCMLRYGWQEAHLSGKTFAIWCMLRGTLAGNSIGVSKGAPIRKPLFRNSLFRNSVLSLQPSAV